MYQVLSPDGFTIDCKSSYGSLKRAEQALNEFVERYTQQGYYSTASRERIPLAELKSYCRIIKQ